MVMTYKVGISQRKICGGVELKYYCIFVRGVLMIPMILGAMVFLLSPVYARDREKGMLKAPAVHYLYMGR